MEGMMGGEGSIWPREEKRRHPITNNSKQAKQAKHETHARGAH